MSHFTVLVVGDDPEAQLGPFHEFECTGENDEYVQDVDITAEVQAQVDKYLSEGKTQGRALRDALEYHGLDKKIVTSEVNADCNGDDSVHKYGYAVVRDDKLIRAVDRTNPNAKWDWYQLGGRWTGFFYIKPDVTSSVLGKVGLMTAAAESDTADACYKRDIDFERMREYAREKATRDYRHFAAVTEGLPIPQSWESIKAQYPDGDNRAGPIYNAQPMVAAMRKDMDLMFSDYEDFGLSEEHYVARAVRNCISTHAVIKDGKWYEKGEMGWWGVVVDEKQPDRWSEEFAKLLEDVSDDTLLSVYDCHI